MKLFAKICLVLALSFVSWQASAQATMPSKTGETNIKRDGVARKFGKMVEIRNGKETPLTKTYTAEDGTKVTSSGMVTYADGTKEKLPEGYAVNKQGQKVIFEDDMIAPGKIREHQKDKTGKTETSITITEKTKVTINEETGRKAVTDTVRSVEVK